MKQPEPGKKIAELRKAKNLTQEELVEQCNLNVRTLQRIESGEVTPRAYTLRVIFKALGYNPEDVLETSGRSAQFNHWVTSHFVQLYTYAADLFNLKTHTMKKLSILSVPFLSVILILFFYVSKAKAQQSREAICKQFEQASSNLKYVQWFNSGNTDSIGLRYMENACMMTNEPTLQGRTEINHFNRQLFDQGLRFVKLVSTAKVIADSIAVDRGVWAINVNAVPVATGTYLTQWHYIKGQWLIENEMSKADRIFDPAAGN